MYMMENGEPRRELVMQDSARRAAYGRIFKNGDREYLPSSTASREFFAVLRSQGD